MAAKKWGNWIAERPLGSTSGQGDTFLVYREDDADRNLFVLKQIKGKGPFGNRIERFRNEILAGMRLDHPNITRVIDPELDQPKPFIVTEYCAGGVLSPTALRGRTLLERIALFRGICDGVAYAHAQGVVHRDLKPDNIFLRADGSPVVGDFGLCFFLEPGQDRVTNVEEAVGARGYMAPECEGGRQEAVLPSSDVYSLGKILYWIMAGRSFARERHRTLEYDLSRDSSDFGMRLVYELLDRMVVEESGQRLPYAGSVVAELDTIRPRIEARRRAVELARRPLRMSGPQEVKIASFRMGGMPEWQSFDPGAARVLGFAGRGQMFAMWGIEGRGQDAEACVAWVGGPRGGWETRQIEVKNPCVPQAMCVDGQSARLLVVSKQTGKEVRIAYLARIPFRGATSLEAVAENVAAPRHSAVAVGPSGCEAVYLGPWEVVRDGRSGTLVRESNGTELNLLSPRTDFPGPLAFDNTGTLHQAIVHQSQGRQLLYLCKRPSETWSVTVVDSTTAGSMSAHISLAINSIGQPVVLGSSIDARSLVIYCKNDMAFDRSEIDIQSIATSFGLGNLDAGSTKQIMFDEANTAHIALMSNGGVDSNQILYLAINEHWRVVDQRAFTANDFLGMGIDGRGSVHIALR